MTDHEQTVDGNPVSTTDVSIGLAPRRPMSPDGDVAPASSAPLGNVPRLPPVATSAARTTTITGSASASTAPVLLGVNRIAPSGPITPPRRAGRRVAVAVVALLVAGCVATAVLVARRSDRDTDQPAAAAGETRPAATGPLATDALSTPPSTLAAPLTLPAATEPFPSMPPSTTPATAAATALTVVVEVDPAVEEHLALVERCGQEERTVFVSLQAFHNQTGAIPDHPDALVDIGWLDPHPDGWSSRWEFTGIDGAIYVMPVSGGACDL